MSHSAEFNQSIREKQQQLPQNILLLIFAARKREKSSGSFHKRSSPKKEHLDLSQNSGSGLVTLFQPRRCIQVLCGPSVTFQRFPFEQRHLAGELVSQLSKHFCPIVDMSSCSW